MAKPIGAQRMVLQAILDASGICRASSRTRRLPGLPGLL